MSFKVLHRGYQHIRLSSSFSLTLIFKTIFVPWRDEKGIESIQFLHGSTALYSTA